jgi:ribosomal protein S18 acetylase RimI-like enzyme
MWFLHDLRLSRRPPIKGIMAGMPDSHLCHIRRLGVDDIEVLRAIRLRALRDAPEAFWTTYESEVDHTPDDWRHWLATAAFFVDDTGRYGIAGGMPDPDDPTAAWLVSMWVAPERRGSGLADQLVSGVMAWAESEGRECIRLHVEEHNQRALRCYQRLGFQFTGRRLYRPRDGRWEVEMAVSFFADVLRGERKCRG